MKLHLLTPPAAQTADSIAVVWDKQGQDKTYTIFLDGEKIGSCQCTDYTITGLQPDTEYVIEVQSEMAAESIKAKTRKLTKVLDVTEFGAVDDGKTLNTEAIQLAIDACPENGIVKIPAGTFLSGAIFLKSDMTLMLDEGAVLLGSPHTKDYPVKDYFFEGRSEKCYASLINGSNYDGSRMKNIAIVGKGKIDANGSKLMKEELAENLGSRGRAICIFETDNLYLYGITVKQSPAWCVHSIYCDGVTMNQIHVRTKTDEDGTRYEGIYNGDGIDPDSCQNVYIIHSVVASQDDCIAVKSGRDEEGRRIGVPSENIRITNCRFLSGFGVAMGSEMSGGVRNVLVQDCEFIDTFSLASVKNRRGRGSVIENVVYEDITFVNNNTEHLDTKWFKGGIYVDQYYGCDDVDEMTEKDVWEGTPTIRNIYFKNITADTIVSSAIYLVGLPEMPLKNICFENVQAAGKWGLKAYNIRGLKMENVSVTAREGETFRMHNVENEEL